MLPNTVKSLDKPTLESLFSRIGEELCRRGLSADITIYGGSALMLRYGYRESTHDVDVVMDKWDEFTLKEITRSISVEKGLDTHWFNDDVQHIVGDNEDTELYRAYLGPGKNGLRVFTPKPEYMLALQVRALASVQLSGDESAPFGKHAIDVQRLVNKLGFDKTQTLDCVRFFFPNRRMPPVVLKWLDVTLDVAEPALA